MDVATEPSLPAAILESVPLPLLHLRADETVQALNPQALDLLGISLFDAIDRPLQELVAAIDPAPELRYGVLPGHQSGRIAALLAPAPTTQSDWLGPLLAELEQRLVRAADGMSLGLPLVNREMFGALSTLRELQLHQENLLLAELLAGRMEAPIGACDVGEILQQVFMTLAPWMRLSGAEVLRAQTGSLEIEGNACLLGRLLEEALLDALANAKSGDRIEIRLANDGDTLTVEIAGGGRTLSICDGIVGLHGGHVRTEENLFAVGIPCQTGESD